MIGLKKFIEVDVSSSGGRKKAILDEAEFMSGGGGDFFKPSKVMTAGLDYPTMESMYKINVWIRACVDKIVKRCTSIKPLVKAILRNPVDKPTKEQMNRIEAIQNLIAVPNSLQQSLAHILTQIYTDILIYDASALELVKGKKSGISDIYAAAGDTIRFNVDRRGVFTNLKKAYIQKDDADKEITSFALDELAYFMQYPRAKRVYGLSPLESLRQTVTAELYASDFNIKRFANDATPRFAVLFDNLGMGQGQPALDRLRQWWDKELKGKPHRPILLGSEQGGIRFEKVGLTNEDMQFQEYSRWLLSKIMAVYHVQPFVLGVIEVNQGRINASYQEEQFKKDAIKPLVYAFSNQFNTLAVWSTSNFNYNDVYLDWEGLDQIDRKLEAEIHEIYMRHGVFTINMVLQQLGMDAVTWGDVPYLFNQLEPINIGGKVPAVPTLPTTTKSISLDGKGDFTFSDWLKTGLVKGGIVPTGLERIEDVDLEQAITKIVNERERIRGKKISY